MAYLPKSAATLAGNSTVGKELRGVKVVTFLRGGEYMTNWLKRLGMLKSSRQVALFVLSTACMSSGALLAGEWEDSLAAFNEGRYADAIASMTPLAEAGNVEAQDQLSHIYYFGDGVPVDYEEALKWTRMAIEQNSSTAQFNMSVHYQKGKGVKQSYSEAIRWLRLAADQDDPAALYNLGRMLETGRGVDAPNPKEGLRLLERAADLGFPSAHLALGIRLLKDHDYDKTGWQLAMPHLILAADARERLAMIFVGTAYVLELAGMQDFDLAALYFRAAIFHGCVDAAPMLAAALISGTPNSLEPLDKQLEEWLSAHPHPRPHNHSETPDSCLKSAKSLDV